MIISLSPIFFTLIVSFFSLAPLEAQSRDSAVNDAEKIFGSTQKTNSTLEAKDRLPSSTLLLALEGSTSDSNKLLDNYNSANKLFFYSLLKEYDPTEISQSKVTERVIRGGNVRDKRDAANFERAAAAAFALVKPRLQEAEKCIWNEDNYGNQVGTELCVTIRDVDHESKQRASNENVDIKKEDIEVACRKDLKLDFCRCFSDNFDRNFSNREYEIFVKNPLAYVMAAKAYLDQYDKAIEKERHTLPNLRPLLNDHRSRYPRTSYMLARSCQQLSD